MNGSLNCASATNARYANPASVGRSSKEKVMTKRTRVLTITVLVTGLLILTGSLRIVSASGPLYVATTGNDSNNCLAPCTPCKTIQAAINKAADGDTINIAAGNYAEAVNIFQRKNLTVAGVAGSDISDPGLPLGAAVVNMQLSENIRFQDLTFSGNPSGVEAIRIFSSTVAVNRSTIEHANLGFFISNNSGVQIHDSTVQDNGTGIRVDGGSVTLTSAPFSPGTSTVQRNGVGVIVRSGDFGMLGATIVQDNGIGINGTGGLIRVCCKDGLRQINNNNVGIQLSGVNLELRGPLQMEGNRVFAIRMFGGFASVSDRVSIRNNGLPETAGILVTGGHLQLKGLQPNDVEISNNPGNGVTLTDNASARIFNTLISNNGAHGVRLQALSVAQLFSTAVMRDNGGFDYSCSPNSFWRGDRSGVRRMFCPGFDQSPNPDPSGPNDQ